VFSARYEDVQDYVRAKKTSFVLREKRAGARVPARPFSSKIKKFLDYSGCDAILIAKRGPGAVHFAETPQCQSPDRASP
jgi:hypothetical protein